MDRKARIREYKETPQQMGVFRVRNTVTGRYFIGSTPNLPAMLNRQRFQLDNGAHMQRDLQSDYEKYGADAFVVEELDTLEPSEEPGADGSAELAELLEMWRERLAESGEPTYNRTPNNGA